MPRRRPSDGAALVDLIIETARTQPGAGTSQAAMAAAIGISSRTLLRWRRELDVVWPPLERDEWQAIISQAQTLQPEVSPTWLVICRITAANLTEVEAKLGTSDITILRIERLSPERTDA